MDDDKPKWLPYVVIAIWLVIAAIVSISVLASNPNRSKTIELIVQLITALSGAAAATAAFLAVRAANQTLKQASEERQADIEAKRPKFILVRADLYLVTELAGDTSISPYFDFLLRFKNIHAHPAINIRLECKILQGARKLLDHVSQPVGEIDYDNTFEITREIPLRGMTEEVAFVRMVISYTDSVTRKEHSQLLYRKFYGPYEDDDRHPIYLQEVDHSEWPDYMESHQRIAESHINNSR